VDAGSVLTNCFVCDCVCVHVCVPVGNSEFGCVRMYATSPPVYDIIEIWQILGPAPIVLNPSNPTIPYGGLPSNKQERNLKYKHARADTAPGAGDGSPFYVLNMWAMMWGSKKPQAGV